MRRCAALDQIAYRIPDAAKLIGIGRSSVYELIAAGLLDARRVAGRSVITAASLRQLIETSPAAPVRRHAVR